MVDNGSLNLFLAFWRPVYCEGVLIAGSLETNHQNCDHSRRSQRQQTPTNKTSKAFN